MFRIMVAEDDPGTRTLMCDVLNDAGYEAIPAKNGNEALNLTAHRHIDLAVLDVMMPGIDGCELTRSLRDAGMDMPVLMVTARVTLDDKKAGFESGADDYMTKPVDEEEFLLHVGALLRRARISAEHKLEIGSTTLYYDSLTVTTGKDSVELPKKEFLLLYKLLSSSGQIFTRRQLMDEIWDLDSESDEHTVNVHINRLRDRFADNPDFDIVTIRGLGYKAVKK